MDTNEELSCQEIHELESFICKIYGCKSLTSVNELRLEMFLGKYKFESNNCIRKMDGSTLFKSNRGKIEKDDACCSNMTDRLEKPVKVLNPTEHRLHFEGSSYKINQSNL